MVLVLAGLLNAGGDAGHKLGLLAVAGEVEQLGATIALQGREEAAQLETRLVDELCYRHRLSSYRAGRHIGQLGAGEAGSNKGNQRGGELHLDRLKNRMCYERRAGKDSQVFIASADELRRRARSGLGRRPFYKLCQSSILHHPDGETPVGKGCTQRLVRGTITCLRMLNERQSTEIRPRPRLTQICN